MKKLATVTVLMAVGLVVGLKVADKMTDGQVRRYVRAHLNKCLDEGRTPSASRDLREINRQLTKIEKDLKNLDEVIEQKAGPVAKLQVELKGKLRKTVEALEIQVRAEEKEALAALDQFKGNGEKFVSLNNVKYEGNDALLKLKERVNGVTILKKRLAGQVSHLKAKEQQYNILRKELANLAQLRNQMRADLEVLRAQYEELRTEALKIQQNPAVPAKFMKLREALEATKTRLDEQKAKRDILQNLDSNNPRQGAGNGQANGKPAVSVENLRQQLVGTKTKTQEITTKKTTE